jgi:hypothetical protein
VFEIVPSLKFLDKVDKEGNEHPDTRRKMKRMKCKGKGKKEKMK